MRKNGHRSAPDKRPQALPKFVVRAGKINQLRIENNSDARKERKRMNDRWWGRHVSIDVKGYYTKRGKHPIKGTYNKASRSMAHARMALSMTPR